MSGPKRKTECTLCGALLEDNRGRKNGAECRECYRAKQNEMRRLRKENRQFEAITMLGGKCEYCGKEATRGNMVCFDFHHQGDKEAEVSQLIGDGKPLGVILEEAKKCILLCACCHRLHHQEHGY